MQVTSTFLNKMSTLHNQPLKLNFLVGYIKWT